MIGLLLAWIGFYGLHSLLASQVVKDWAQTWLGAHYRWYRLGYNVLALGTFLAVVGYQRQLPDQPLWTNAWWVYGIALVLLLAGGWVAMLGGLQYDLGAFAGTSPPRPDPSASLVQKGVHRWVRHPLYSGVVLILLAYLIAFPSLNHLLMVGLSFGYLIVGIYWEEKKLIAEFGDTYREYRQEVKALIPFVW